MKKRDHILFYLNGERIEVRGEDTFMMLADYLRVRRSLTGTKIVCAEGDCGACSVLRYFPYLSASKKVVYESINSCITTVAQMDGSSLITVDALAKDEALTPVQDCMVKSNGSQCGFCTPGFIIAMTGMIEKKSACGARDLKAKDAKNALTGNLCRCTGYQPIIDATLAVDVSKHEPLQKRFYSREQEQDLLRALKTPLEINHSQGRSIAPLSVKEAALVLAKDPMAKIFSGGTDLGVQVNKGKLKPKTLISLHQMKELYAIQKKSGRIVVGARVTLAELRRFIEDSVSAFSSFLDIFASPQIKNVATLVGNIANGSPIGDTLPFLLVSGTRVHVQGPLAKRIIPIEKFWVGYRKLSLKKGELITAVDFEIPVKNQYLKLFKSSQRKDLDISAIGAAFRLEWDPKTKTIKDARLAMGGVAATPLRLPQTEKILIGRKWSEELVTAVNESIQKEITPLDDLRGTAAFRRVLTKNLISKYLHEWAAQA